MNNIIEIRNMNFGYQKKALFKNFSLCIKEGTFNTLVGNSSCGKSTLAKVMAGLINSSSFVKIDGLFVNPKNLKTIRRLVGITYENPTNQFVSSTIEEDFILLLRSFEYDELAIKDKINKIKKIFNIDRILALKPNELSGGEKQLVSIAMALCHNPKLLILDNSLSMLDYKTKSRVIEILKELNNQGLTIINITSNCEDILFGTDLVVLVDGKLILQSPVDKAFDKMEVFTENNISLPFIVELSRKLKYYKVIDHVYFSEKKLVDDLWK